MLTCKGEPCFFINMQSSAIFFAASQHYTIRIPKGLHTNIFQTFIKSVLRIAAALIGPVNHHMPYIILRDIIVINHHNIAHHFFTTVDSKWLTLISIYISLRQTSDWMRDKFLLTLSQPQMKCLNKIILGYGF